MNAGRILKGDLAHNDYERAAIEGNVLRRWQAGMGVQAIAERVPALSANTIGRIIRQAARRGDPRAEQAPRRRQA